MKTTAQLDAEIAAALRTSAALPKLTTNERDALGLMIQSPNRTSAFFPTALRRVLSKLVEKNLARAAWGDSYQRAQYRTYRATDAGKVAYYAALEER